MQKIFLSLSILSILFLSCNNSGETTGNSSAATDNTTAATVGGQENVKDDDSQKDVVKIASENKDFSTLVAAVKQAGLVTTLSNAGPFTVFAPNNAAFDKLPSGTVDALMKDNKKDDLTDILQYHVYVGVLQKDMLQEGQKINMVNGKNVTISVNNGEVTLNGNAKIIATVPAANGVIHVIDNVLQEPTN